MSRLRDYVYSHGPFPFADRQFHMSATFTKNMNPDIYQGNIFVEEGNLSQSTFISDWVIISNEDYEDKYQVVGENENVPLRKDLDQNHSVTTPSWQPRRSLCHHWDSRVPQPATRSLALERVGKPENHRVIFGILTLKYFSRCDRSCTFQV